MKLEKGEWWHALKWGRALAGPSSRFILELINAEIQRIAVITFDGLHRLVPEDGELVAAEVQLLQSLQVGECLRRHSL